MHIETVPRLFVEHTRIKKKGEKDGGNRPSEY